MSERLPIRATVNATYATLAKAPVRFTLVGLLPPIGLLASFYIAGVLSTRMLAGGSPLLAWAGVTVLALEYALFILCMGAILSGAAEVQRGRTFAIGAAFALSFRRLPALLVASLPILITGGVLTYDLVTFAGWTAGLAGLGLVLIDITFFALTMPVCLVERRGPLASLRRSLVLTRGNGLRLFASIFIALVPIGLAAAVVRVAGSPVADLVTGFLATALQFATLTILSVVALDTLAPPVDEVAAAFE